MTETKVVQTATFTRQAGSVASAPSSQPGGLQLVPGAIAPSTPTPTASANWWGWRQMNPPGCYTFNDFATYYNAVGWALYTGGFTFYNWCWNGSTDYTTPTASEYVNAHWGRTWCGNPVPVYYGWVQQDWGWKAAGQFAYGAGNCIWVTVKSIGGEVWGNGHYDWWG